MLPGTWLCAGSPGLPKAGVHQFGSARVVTGRNDAAGTTLGNHSRPEAVGDTGEVRRPGTVDRDWLADDISVLDPNLLVIGRQVRTSFGGAVDLLCMDGDGNLVVVELKRGRTPRDVTSQALEYSSWVKDLDFDEVTRIADSYLGGSGSLGQPSGRGSRRSCPSSSTRPIAV